MNFNRSSALAAALVALVVSGCGQPGDFASPDLEPQFGTAADDRAYAVARHSTGVYVVGTTSGSLHATHKGQGDAYLRKYDAGGRLLWGRQFGTNASDNALDVAVDANNNAYVLGNTGGTLARALRGPSDFFLRKYSPSGAVLWTNQMGLDTADLPGGVAASGGFVYVAGVSRDLGTFVYRFNAKGGTSWKRQVAPALQYKLASDVAVDGGGNVYVASTTPDDCGDWWDCTDAQLNKYNTSGTLVWSKQVDYNDEDVVIALAAHGGSVYLATEDWSVSDDDRSTRLVKLNTSGVAQWSRYTSAYSRYQPPSYISTDLSADANGVYTVSTETIYFPGSDPEPPHYSVAKFDTGGSLAWRVGPLYDYDGWEGEFIAGTLWGVVARGGELYVAGSVDGGAGRGDEALLKRLSPSTGSTVWTR